MLLLEFNSNTSIQVSPSSWGGNPRLVVRKLYSQLAKIQPITKSEISTAKNKSRSRAPKSPYTGQSKSLTTGKALNNLSQIPLSSWNPQYASWAPAPLTPHNCYNTQSNTLTFIRNTVHTNQCHTVTRDFPNEKNTQQPPGHRTYLECETRGKVGKTGPTDKYNSQHDKNTASQKYEDYIREYTLHRNKCIDIIRTAFQDIRDVLKERESQRKNNLTSRNLQHNVNTEIDQMSDPPHQVTDKNHTNHKLHTPDTNPHLKGAATKPSWLPSLLLLRL